jgi:hypothetical protein
LPKSSSETSRGRKKRKKLRSTLEDISYQDLVKLRSAFGGAIVRNREWTANKGAITAPMGRLESLETGKYLKDDKHGNAIFEKHIDIGVNRRYSAAIMYNPEDFRSVCPKCTKSLTIFNPSWDKSMGIPPHDCFVTESDRQRFLKQLSDDE